MPVIPLSLPSPPGLWENVEDAIRTWVKNASGLSDAHVLWAEQTGARPPSGDFMTIRLGDIVPLGAVDELLELTDLDRPAGQEIELRAMGVREFHVSVQAFSAATVRGNTARAQLARVQNALRLPSFRDALDEVGLSPFDAGTVRNVTELVGTKFEGRAVLDVRFYVADTVSEFVGYIDDVETTSYMGPPDEGTLEEIDI